MSCVVFLLRFWQTSPPLLYGPRETLSFVAHRAVPLFGVLARVLGEVATATPDFKPSSVLDFGCGACTSPFSMSIQCPEALVGVLSVSCAF